MTMKSNQKSLEDRVRRLERQNRAWMCACALVGSGALFAAAQPDPIPDVIRAKSFEVVSDHGIAVASLRSTNQGGMIAVNDIGGSAKVTLGINGDLGGFISANNEQGDPLVLLEARSNMNNLKLDGKSALDAMVESELWGRIAINDRRGRSLVAASGFPGTTSLVLRQTMLDTQIEMLVEGEGCVVRTKGARDKAEMRNDALYICNDGDSPNVAISAIDGGGSITLLTNDGEAFAALGKSTDDNGFLGLFAPSDQSRSIHLEPGLSIHR